VAPAGLPDLAVGEEVITTGAEFLWRNQNPAWVDTDGSVTSQLFKPTPKDGGMVSVARSSVVTAEEHFNDYAGLGLQSVAVWGVTVQQVLHQSGIRRVVVRCVDNSTIITAPRGHGYVDFRAVSGNQSSKLGAQLRTAAVGNGRFYTQE
jgi:hypothetical protein